MDWRFRATWRRKLLRWLVGSIPIEVGEDVAQTPVPAKTAAEKIPLENTPDRKTVFVAVAAHGTAVRADPLR